MKIDVEVKILDEIDRRLREMPDFICDFIYHTDTKTTKKTQLAYLKDLKIFLEFLQITNSKDIKEFTVYDIKVLKERDIRDFFSYITRYTKTFNSKSGKEVAQTFTNTPVGKTRKLATLRNLYEYLSGIDFLDIKDVTKKIEFKLNQKKGITNKLESDEIRFFLDCIMEDVNIETERKKKFHERVRFRDYIMTLVLCFTGIRISELVQLDIEDVNLDKEHLMVIRKGGSIENVYMPDDIIPLIREYIEERKCVFSVDPTYKNALFLSLQRKRIDPKTVRYMLKKYRDRSEISMKITPHTLRRSFALAYYNLHNKDIELCRKQLGHSSIETTRKFYAEASEERAKGSIKSFSFFEKSKNLSNSDKISENFTIDDTLNSLAKATGKSIEEIKANLGMAK